METPSECDRCSAEIVYDNFSRRRPFAIQLNLGGTDRETFDCEQRVLCSACEKDLLKWIDGDFTREDAVDLPDRIASGDNLRMVADELNNLADDLEQVND